MALGFKGLGSEALGFKGLGSKALGFKGLGSKGLRYSLESQGLGFKGFQHRVPQRWLLRSAKPNLLIDVTVRTWCSHRAPSVMISATGMRSAAIRTACGFRSMSFSLNSLKGVI